MLKLWLSYLAGVVVAAYRAFVLTLMWNWFVSPIFHVGSISFWYALGLLWIVQLFIGKFDESDELTQSSRWETAFWVLDLCVPEDRKKELQEELHRRLEQKEGDIWVLMPLMIFSQAIEVTLTLFLAWLVHGNFIHV